MPTSVLGAGVGRSNRPAPTIRINWMGTYAIPFGDGSKERRREITAQELGALLSGIDLKQATRRKRYQRSV